MLQIRLLWISVRPPESYENLMDFQEIFTHLEESLVRKKRIKYLLPTGRWQQELVRAISVSNMRCGVTSFVNVNRRHSADNWKRKVGTGFLFPLFNANNFSSNFS